MAGPLRTIEVHLRRPENRALGEVPSHSGLRWNSKTFHPLPQRLKAHPQQFHCLQRSLPGDLGQGECVRTTSFADIDACLTLSHLQPQLVEQHEDADVVAAGAISCDAAIMAALTIRSSGMAS